jgi:hypothetical protein
VLLQDVADRSGSLGLRLFPVRTSADHIPTQVCSILHKAKAIAKGFSSSSVQEWEYQR